MTQMTLTTVFVAVTAASAAAGAAHAMASRTRGRPFGRARYQVVAQARAVAPLAGRRGRDA